jgi:hypothetical protein
MQDNVSGKYRAVQAAAGMAKGLLGFVALNSFQSSSEPKV